MFYEQTQQTTLKTFASEYPTLSSLYIIIGSEGGFSTEEVNLAQQHGSHIISLGSSILRAETASIVAVSLCRFLWDTDPVPPLPSQVHKT